jgi:hypothetical protein
MLNRIQEFIFKLDRLTEEGKIKWERDITPPSLEAICGDFRILDFYSTNFEGKIIGIYREQYKFYNGEKDEMYDSERINLGFFDKDGNCDWNTRNENGLWQLFETIRMKTAGIGDYLQKVLAE